MKKKIIFCFDIDNTICDTKKSNYLKSKPIYSSIKVINHLYDKGHIIKIYTARFMGRNNENRHLAKKQGLTMTKEQLKKWNLNYDELIFGKPSYDLFIDDKNFGFKKNWAFKLKKYIDFKRK